MPVIWAHGALKIILPVTRGIVPRVGIRSSLRGGVADEATFAALTPPLALLAALSCFTLRLKPRKTGNPENNSSRKHSRKTGLYFERPTGLSGASAASRLLRTPPIPCASLG
jgi:hypothetical protein